MANSKVTVTFNSIHITDEQLILSNSLSAINLEEIFSQDRVGNGFSEIGDTIDDCAYNYSRAIILDYSLAGLYNVSVDSNTVTIEATQENVVFSEVFLSTPLIVVNIQNVQTDPSITVDDFTFSEALTNPCQQIITEVTTNVLAVEYSIESFVWVLNDQNPFNFTMLRGLVVTLLVKDAEDNVFQQSIQSPAALTEPTTYIEVVNAPTGATITVTHNSTYLLNLEYSIDNINWKTSNVFQGLDSGAYTLYVRDQFGCEISKGFSVNIFTPDTSVTEPFNYLSKAMSIRYKTAVNWGLCSNYKIEENTLSCEYNSLLPYGTIQQFQTCDTAVTTQFKCNYETNLAYVIEEDGTEIPIDIFKQSNNIGATDRRDANMFKYAEGQTGIFYTSGNTYDYSTGIANGTYELNGLLPNYGEVGNYVNVDGYGWYQIVDIDYNAANNSDILIIDLEYEGDAVPVIVSSQYNIEDYDIYEFYVNMSLYDGKIIQIKLINSDTTFGTVTRLSEKIEVAEEFDDLICLEYYNPTNTDVFYSNGFKNKIRVNYENFVEGIDMESEGLNTDTSSILIDSQMYETATITFSPVTVGIMRQITQALIHKELYINDVKYRIKDGGIELEPYGQTNLNVITAELIKAENVFNSSFDGNQYQDATNTEMVGLIKNDGKYIKIH